MEKKRILIGSPVHQKAGILKEYLLSLQELVQDTVCADYLLMDDNTDEESVELLQTFQRQDSKATVVRWQGTTSYERDEYTHYWRDDAIWRVAAMKDAIIHHAKKHDYDYLFLVDSDLILHPNTLEQLVKSDKSIISNIFWTRWQPNTIEMPQVWVQDEYSFYTKNRSKPLSDEEISAHMLQFLTRLRTPGVYEVGGLGACTLISCEAIRAGVRFEQIKNLSFWGEDRHFCIRAAALGFSLYVNTHYPAYHIYRESELAGVPAFKQRNGLSTR